MPIINMVYKKPSWPSLKSYEEIIAMSVDGAVAELNTNPTAYYEKLNSEWHIYVSWVLLYVANQSWTWRYNFDWAFWVYYRTDTKVWDFVF